MDNTKLLLGALLPMVVALVMGAEAVEAQNNPEMYPNRLTAPSRMIRVNVENQNWTKIRVYVAVAGGYVAIGTARRMGRTTFSIPARLLGGRSTLRLLAHPIDESQNTVVGRVRILRDRSANWAIRGMVVSKVNAVRV